MTEEKLPRSVRYSSLGDTARADLISLDLGLIADQFPGVADSLKYTPKREHHRIADKLVLELGLAALEERIEKVARKPKHAAKPQAEPVQ